MASGKTGNRDGEGGLRALTKLRALLGELAGTIGRDPRLREADKLIRAAEDELRAAAGGRTKRRTGVGTEYAVEVVDQREVLTERRLGGTSPPFRVGKDMYSIIAGVLDEVKKPVDFEFIVKLATRKSNGLVAEFHVRTCLRFWMRHDPPLLSRSRTRYLPAEAGNFVGRAEKAWRDSFNIR
jgi:hypothetical protein